MGLASKIMPVRMVKLKCLILDDYVEEVLIALQRLATIHLVNLQDSLSRWEKLPEPHKASDEIKFWEEISSRIEKILRKLNIKRDLGLLEEIFQPEKRKSFEITHNEELELLNETHKIVDEVEKDIEENISRYKLVKKFLMEIRNLPIDVEKLRSSEELYITIGQATTDKLSRIEKDIKRKLPHTVFYSKGKGRKKFVAIIALRRFEDQINSLLEDKPFEQISIPEDLTDDPPHCIRLIDDKQNEVLKRNGPLAMKLHDSINCKIERLNALEKMGKTERLFVLEGWIPKERTEEVEKVVQKASKGYAKTLVEEPDEPERNIPSLLRKRKIIDSFKVITEMYGLPSYNEIDPTPVIAFFFPFFVGIMMGDISLGAILLLGGFLINRGAGSRSEKMAALAKILLLSGVISIFFGVLTGQFMGGAIEMFSQGQIVLPVFWMSPADEPIDFMLTVLVIGVVHLLVGLLLGVINNLANRQIRTMVGDQISMLLMFLGGAIIVVTGNYQFDGYGIWGYSAVIGGLAALLISKGPIGLLEITKIISNIISYVRILALNMASTWMGRTFVLLAGMLINIEYFGLPISIILLLFSQFFLVFISSFSTFAHSMRLHYVEFFGRFFTGGGVIFSPLKCEKMYTELKMGE
jgi:V/A-type H+-transporting ATPase subunit I